MADLTVEYRPIRGRSPRRSAPADRGAPKSNAMRTRLETLAEKISRLTVDRHDPHRFYEDRSELAREARRLAAEC